MSAESENSALVSVIVAAFNAKSTLQQCIDSVQNQTYRHKELIIIDGGSNDGTAELLLKNSEGIDYWVSEPDDGIYNAWNKGLERVKGDWVCFLGADDYLWDRNVLERMVESLGKLPQSVNVAYGQIMLLGAEEQSSRLIGEPWGEVRESFKQFMSIPHVGMMHRRKLFEQKGKFDESFQIAGDYELLLRELITGDAVFVPGLIVAGQRYGGISTDAKNNLKIKLEVWRAQRMHRLPLPWGAVLKEIANEYFLIVLNAALGERLAATFVAWLKRIRR